MKILQVVTYFSRKMGGEFNVCLNLSIELQKLGNEITIIATDVMYDSDVARHISNIEIIPFKCLANVASFMYTPSMAIWLSAHVKEYDVVHIHGYRGYQTNVAAKYALKYNIPYIIQPHGSFPKFAEKKYLKCMYDTLWGKHILKSSKAIIAVVEEEKTMLQKNKIDMSSITTIYNGINMNSYSPHAINRRLCPHESPIILYVGRIHPRKGVDILIQSFKKILIKKPSAILRIVGHGDEKYVSDLHNLCHELEISDSVKFIGFADDIAKEYANSDVLVYPSRYEIFGLVPFEALIFGTPVVVSNDSGCGYIIESVDCRYLTNYGDIDGIANIILHVLNEYDEG